MSKEDEDEEDEGSTGKWGGGKVPDNPEDEVEELVAKLPAKFRCEADDAVKVTEQTFNNSSHLLFALPL